MSQTDRNSQTDRSVIVYTNLTVFALASHFPTISHNASRRSIQKSHFPMQHNI